MGGESVATLPPWPLFPTCRMTVHEIIVKREILPEIYRFILVFSKYPFWWDRVGMDFSGRVPGYSRRWAIISDSTKISTVTNLKLTEIMGSNHLLYISSPTIFAFKTVRHRRNVNQEKISVHSKHGCLLQCP